MAGGCKYHYKHENLPPGLVAFVLGMWRDNWPNCSYTIAHRTDGNVDVVLYGTHDAHMAFSYECGDWGNLTVIPPNDEWNSAMRQ